MSGTGANLSYQFDVPPGQYTVTLGFVETKYTIRNGRVFGFEVLNVKGSRQDLDVFAQAGANKPWTKTFRSVSVAAGEKLVIKFYPTAHDAPMINAIEIMQE